MNRQTPGAAYHRIEAIARANELKVLADAAQSFGAVLHNRRVGSFGDATAVSFFPSKPLGCYGDGGAVLAADPATAETIRRLRVHGSGLGGCSSCSWASPWWFPVPRK